MLQLNGSRPVSELLVHRHLRQQRWLIGGVLAACTLLFAHLALRTPYVHVPDRLGGVETVDISVPSSFYRRPAAEHYRQHVDRMFAPWRCLADDDEASFCKKPVTPASLSALEWLGKGGSYRIRFTGTDILYRPLVTFGQTYRVQRLHWIMDTIREMTDQGLLTRTVGGKSVRFDAVFRVGDSPQVTKDTLSKDAGYLLFGLRSSPLHLDVPIPDPPAYGSNGNYVWPPRSELHSWNEKVDKVVFRGSASFSFGVDNWQTNNRIRIAQLGSKYPHLIDAGLTQFRPKEMPPLTSEKFTKGSAFFQLPSAARIQSMSNLVEAESISMVEQSGYKYIIDVDGGLGSSRRVGLLQSGSVPFFVDSPYFGNFEPTLRPWVHYVPVDEYLADLPAKVEWLKAHDGHAKFIVRNAIAFAEAYLSKQAAMEQFAEMLKAYADLQSPAVDLDSSDVLTDFCDVPGGKELMMKGPQGCDKGWKTWNGSKDAV
ncbi:hypothetical protein JCM9279_000236 [Rhodotorula babjevae]